MVHAVQKTMCVWKRGGYAIFSPWWGVMQFYHLGIGGVNIFFFLVRGAVCHPPPFAEIYEQSLKFWKFSGGGPQPLPSLSLPQPKVRGSLKTTHLTLLPSNALGFASSASITHLPLPKTWTPYNPHWAERLSLGATACRAQGQGHATSLRGQRLNVGFSYKSMYSPHTRCTEAYTSRVKPSKVRVSAHGFRTLCWDPGLRMRAWCTG